VPTYEPTDPPPHLQDVFMLVTQAITLAAAYAAWVGAAGGQRVLLAHAVQLGLSVARWGMLLLWPNAYFRQRHFWCTCLLLGQGVWVQLAGGWKGSWVAAAPAGQLPVDMISLLLRGACMQCLAPVPLLLVGAAECVLPRMLAAGPAAVRSVSVDAAALGACVLLTCVLDWHMRRRWLVVNAAASSAMAARQPS